MTRTWKLAAPVDEAKVTNLAQSLNISPWLATLLVQRGIQSFDEAKLFFRPDVAHLHDPFLMKNMDVAINRLHKALTTGEKICIYGDYDVDGTTSVALVYLFLKPLYPHIECYIPDRYTEGYGISTQGIDYAHQNGISLIIALDCGIKAVDKIAYANARNIDFIICDHHTPGVEVPNAVAVLDPKQVDCTYPFKELSGCGVGFKLLQAYCIQQQIDQQRLFDLIDLVVVSIAADIVPITGENRVLAFLGLQKLNTNPLPGLQCLLGVAGITKNITISNVVFGLAPRINAAGRIDHADSAVKLLTAASLEEATPFGKLLQDHNSSRRELDTSTLQEALLQIQQLPDADHRKSTVIFDPQWHKGVVGIVASKCIEHYYRPTIVLCQSNGHAVGSARSVQGFDLYEALQSCQEVLVQFGGHMHAAGLMLEIDRIPEFTQKFEDCVSKRITNEQLTPTIDIDLEIPLSNVTPKAYNIIKQMAPFGPGNLSPLFVTHGVRDSGRARVVGETHLKLDVIGSDGKTAYPAIAFNLGHMLNYVQQNTFDICYAIEENTYNGHTSLQLQIKDIR